MGIQDRDYCRDALREREAPRRRQVRQASAGTPNGWAVWFVAGCAAFLVLVVCIAVWMARR